MKRNITSLLLLSALGLATSCSEREYSETTDMEREHIELHASGSGLTAVTRSDESINPFQTTIFASTRKGLYTNLTLEYEWVQNAKVEADGNVSYLNTNNQPNYPRSGAWIYLVAVAPIVPDESITIEGAVTYQLDGKTDLLYAKEIQGNKWDGYRFAGNPNRKDDKPLNYVHLLTRLLFEAKTTANISTPVAIRKITVQGVKTMVTIPLNSGVPAFSDNLPLSLVLAEDGTTLNTTNTPLGGLLLSPLTIEDTAYKVTVETSVGTFRDVVLSFTGEEKDAPFQAGQSHLITLIFDGTSLKISTTIEKWGTATGGNLDIN